MVRAFLEDILPLGKWEDIHSGAEKGGIVVDSKRYVCMVRPLPGGVIGERRRLRFFRNFLTSF